MRKSFTFKRFKLIFEWNAGGWEFHEFISENGGNFTVKRWCIAIVFPPKSDQKIIPKWGKDWIGIMYTKRLKREINE